MKKFLAGLVTGLFLFGMVGMAEATIIFQDNFDLENGGKGTVNYSNFINWTVSDGTVDITGNGFCDMLPATYGLYVDLDGSTHNAGLLTSIQLDLSPGDYLFEFDLAGSQRRHNPADHSLLNPYDTVTVKLGSLFSRDYTLDWDEPIATYSEMIHLDTTISLSISFQDHGHNSVGILLDNVALTKVEPVPEPATMVLLGFGLVGLAGIGRKKLRK